MRAKLRKNQMTTPVLFCMVSHNGGRYTICYARDPSTSAECISREGYTIDLFDEVPRETPVFRFDLTPYDTVLSHTFDHTVCSDYETPYRPGMSYPVTEYIAWTRSRGIAVETIGAMSPILHNNV
jgi:hypothetical protein